MQLFHGYRNGVAKIPPLVYAIGNFDGVHLGHLSLLEIAKKIGVERGLDFGVYTFWPHPRAILKPGAELKLITTREQKLELLRKFGVNVVVEEPFTPEFAELSGHDFCAQVIASSLRASAVVTGENFRFGCHAAGTPEKMSEWLAPLSVDHVLAPSVFVEGELCSSSRIRNFVLAGEVEKAALMLGRPFAVAGRVISGAGRGRRIGVPTANLVPESTLLPPAGVYATSVRVGDNVYRAATNVGTRPTFSNASEIHVESHLINFDQDIYDANIEIFFHKKIREEKRFESVESLKAQIQEDLRIIIHYKP